MNGRLYRSRDDRMLAGVAGGLAEYWDADPSLVRLIWALLVIFTGGLALIVYVVMAIVVADAPDSVIDGAAIEATRAARRAARRERRSGGGRMATVVFGALLLFAGVWFLVEELFPAFDTDLFWPAALIVLGIGLLVAAVRPRGPESTPHSVPPMPPSPPAPTTDPGNVAGAKS